jgi:hypothetical protein
MWAEDKFIHLTILKLYYMITKLEKKIVDSVINVIQFAIFLWIICFRLRINKLIFKDQLTITVFSGLYPFFSSFYLFFILVF